MTKHSLYERVDEAIERGEMWRAKEILRGNIGTSSYDSQLYERYGRLLLDLGEMVEAGKYLFPLRTPGTGVRRGHSGLPVAPPEASSRAAVPFVPVGRSIPGASPLPAGGAPDTRGAGPAAALRRGRAGACRKMEAGAGADARPGRRHPCAAPAQVRRGWLVRLRAPRDHVAVLPGAARPDPAAPGRPGRGRAASERLHGCRTGRYRPVARVTRVAARRQPSGRLSMHDSGPRT